MLAWPAADGMPALIILVLVAGFADGLTLPAIIVARQRYSPPELLAQVSVTGASMKVGAFAAGSTAGGWLVPELGSSSAILLVAAGQLGAAGLGLLAARTGRGDRDDPDVTAPPGSRSFWRRRGVW